MGPQIGEVTRLSIVGGEIPPGGLPCLLDQVKSLSPRSNFAIVNVSRYWGRIHVASFKVKGLQQEQQVLPAYHICSYMIDDHSMILRECTLRMTGL